MEIPEEARSVEKEIRRKLIREIVIVYWINKLVKSRFTDKDGCISDYEEFLKLPKKHTNFRLFFKEMVKEGVIMSTGTRQVKGDVTYYVIDKKDGYKYSKLTSPYKLIVDVISSQTLGMVIEQ